VGADQDVARIERALGDLLRVSSSNRLHEARLRATGLQITQTEYRFLGRLVDQGPMSVSDLATALEMSQPTASRSLRQLETDGMVARKADASDGRVARYEATARGRRTRRRLLDHMHGQLTEVLAGMPERRRHELAVLLDELVNRLHGRAISA